MKKLIFNLILLLLTPLALSAQLSDKWRLGLQFGCYGNWSEFSGGMSDAPAAFSHDPFGTGSFDINVRYEHSLRWAFQTGLNFTSIGFNFTLANDYNLNDECNNRYDMLESSIPVMQVPVMAMYKTKNSCKNWRWVFGAGVVNSFTGDNQYSNEATFTQQQEQNPEFMKVETRSSGSYHFMTRFMIGREKEFKKGGMLTFMLQGNCGYTEMGYAQVTYNTNNRLYHHEFSNNGSYCGFSIAYTFRPWGRKQVEPPVNTDPLPLKNL